MDDVPDISRPIGPIEPPSSYTCDVCGFNEMLFEDPLDGEHGDARVGGAVVCSGAARKASVGGVANIGSGGA